MLPQIPLLSTPVPTSGATVPLVPTTGDAPRVGHPAVSQPQTGNFAAVFAANLPRLQGGTAEDLADMPPPDTDGSEGAAEASAEKQASNASQTDEGPQKDTVATADVDDTKGFPAAKPDFAHAPHEKAQGDYPQTAQSDGTERPVPAGTPQEKSPLAADPWQVAVLPKAAVPIVPPNSSQTIGISTATASESKDLAMQPVMGTPTAGPGTPLVGAVPVSESAPKSAPAEPFVARLTARFASSAPQEQPKLVARVAEPSAPLAQNSTQTPVQPVATATAPIPTDQVSPAKVNGAGTIASPLGSDRIGAPLPGNVSSPPSAAPAPVPQPEPTLLGAAAKPDQKSPAPVANGHVPRPTAAPIPTTTSQGAPNISDGSPQTVQPPQKTNATPLLQPQHPVTQVVTVAKSTAPSAAERRITARFEPVLQPAKPSPIEVTKLAAPLVPWQALALAPSEQTSVKDTLAIDPISGEPRLTSLTAQNTHPNAPQRTELPPQIARQLAEVIQQNPNRPVEITLKPQELGAVRLSVQQAEAGIIVSLTAERPETLDLMRRHIDQLGQEFQAMGYANIAFSFAGSDAGSDAHPDDTAASGTAESEDGTAAPAAHINLATGTTGGVDLRL